MTQNQNAETAFQRLKEIAVNRLGEERTKVLTPTIREMAASLAAVRCFRLREDEEPAFFR